MFIYCDEKKFDSTILAFTVGTSMVVLITNVPPLLSSPTGPDRLEPAGDREILVRPKKEAGEKSGQAEDPHPVVNQS